MQELFLYDAGNSASALRFCISGAFAVGGNTAALEMLRKHAQFGHEGAVLLPVLATT